MDNGTPLHQMIATRLKELREKAGMRQEEVALFARRGGLPWRRSLIAQIETGRRHITFGELLLLPRALSASSQLREAAGHVDEPIRIVDLLPKEGEVSLTSEAAAPAWLVRKIVEQLGTITDANEEQFLTTSHSKRIQDFTRVGALTTQLWGAGGASSKIINLALAAEKGEAEQTAARTLKVSPAEVCVAAYWLWKQSLTDKREALLGERQGSSKPLDERGLKIRRGHISRHLLANLRPLLTQAGTSSHRRSLKSQQKKKTK